MGPQTPETVTPTLPSKLRFKSEFGWIWFRRAPCSPPYFLSVFLWGLSQSEREGTTTDPTPVQTLGTTAGTRP